MSQLRLNLVFGLVLMSVAIFQTECVQSQEDSTRLIPLPYVTLSDPPPMLLDSDIQQAETVSAEDLKQAIASLSELDTAVDGLEVGFDDFQTLGLLGRGIDPESDSLPSLLKSQPVRELLKAGPFAVPLLLEQLDNTTPTSIVMSFESDTTSLMQLYRLSVLHGNLVNPDERIALCLRRSCYEPELFFLRSKMEHRIAERRYVISVGDVCFWVLGQIVGRDYRPFVCIDKFETAVTSPSADPVVLTSIKRIWEHDAIPQRLAESLMMDFCSRGVLQGDSLDFWEEGNALQVSAAHRLLAYYPQLGQRLLKERLSNLQLGDDDFENDVKNGVRVDELIRVLRPFPEPAFKDLLIPISQNSDTAAGWSARSVLKSWQERSL